MVVAAEKVNAWAEDSVVDSVEGWRVAAAIVDTRRSC